MKAIDLFCGCGGLSLGFQNAGIEIVSAYDHWDSAIQCYNSNFTHKATKLDISNFQAVVTELSNYKFDLIIGGPPCQDFSSAGKRIEGDRAELSKMYARIIDHFKPRWFVMENVARFVKTNTYEEVIQIYKTAGYGLTTRILNASHYGVPQKRKRFFCIGLLNADDNFLDAAINKVSTMKEMSIIDYLIKTYGKNVFGIERYYRHPRSYSRRAIFSINEPAPTMRGVNRPQPSNYKIHKNDAIIDTETVRALETGERAIIQTFPSNFVFPCAKTETEQMIGNAVPVNLASAIGKAIIEFQTEIS